MSEFTTTQEWKIGDCKDAMHEMDANSVDLIVTDPPYGYSMMNLGWDRVVPSIEIWQECLRILKPGAFAFIMSAPRQDVLAHNLVNLSDAGFETGFTSIYWTFASGFPKAGNIGKMVDKRFGESSLSKAFSTAGRGDRKDLQEAKQSLKYRSDYGYVHKLKNDQSQTLDGSYAGFQPKPAVEVVMVVMKPLSKKTYIDQALVNQKGITWLDDGRIPYQSDGDIEQSKNNFKPSSDYDAGNTNYKLGIVKTDTHQNASGRFPANLLVSDGALNDGNVKNVIQKSYSGYDNKFDGATFNFGNGSQDRDRVISDSGSFSRYFDLDAWWNERIKHLPKEAQKTFPFMIVPKASKREKGKDNKHPTVKPVKLFSWLITIGSREGDIVVDPFLGSGVALAAGRMTNRNVMGIEIDPQWEHLYADRCLKHTPSLFSF